MPEISKFKKVQATAIGVHNASTNIVVAPTVSGATRLGRNLKNRYAVAKEAKLRDYEAQALEAEQAPTVVDSVPSDIVSL